MGKLSAFILNLRLFLILDPHANHMALVSFLALDSRILSMVHIWYDRASALIRRLNLFTVLFIVSPYPSLPHHSQFIWPGMPFLYWYAFSWRPVTFCLPLNILTPLLPQSWCLSLIFLRRYVLLYCFLDKLLGFQVPLDDPLPKDRRFVLNELFSCDLLALM